MAFLTQISNFLNTGSLYPQIDDGGNIYLNSQSLNFNQNYVSIPLQTSEYNSGSITIYYNTEFTEFVSVIPSMSLNNDNLNNEITQLQYTTASLIGQLNSLISTQLNNSPADIQAVQQLIINLRISLGQGVVAADFSTIFPYYPLTSNSNSTISNTLLSSDLIPSSSNNTVIATSITSTASMGIQLTKTPPYLLGWPPTAGSTVGTDYASDPRGGTTIPDGVGIGAFPFIKCKIVNIDKTNNYWNTLVNANKLDIGTVLTFEFADGRPPYEGIYRWFVYWIDIVTSDGTNYVTIGPKQIESTAPYLEITRNMANDIYVEII